MVKGGDYESVYVINGLSKSKKNNLLFIDVYFWIDGKKVYVPENQIKISDGEITVSLTSQSITFTAEARLEYFVLWTNPVYQELQR